MVKNFTCIFRSLGLPARRGCGGPLSHEDHRIERRFIRPTTFYMVIGRFSETLLNSFGFRTPSSWRWRHISRTGDVRVGIDCRVKLYRAFWWVVWKERLRGAYDLIEGADEPMDNFWKSSTSRKEKTKYLKNWTFDRKWECGNTLELQIIQ